MSEDCSNCRFWKHFDGRHGDCRRNAPAARDSLSYHIAETLGHMAWAQYTKAGINPEEVPDLGIEYNGLAHASWPRTENVDWCGEYQARISPALQSASVTK